MNHKIFRNMKRHQFGLLGALLSASALNTVSAANFETADRTINGSFVSTFTLGLGIRGTDPACTLTGDPSAVSCGTASNTRMWSAGDDGDLNYRRGDAFTTYVKGTHELMLNMPEQRLTFMARASYLYDAAADSTARTELSDEAKRKVARDVRLLDLWVSKGFDIGDLNGRVRLGNQVINWGESLFLAGGINNTSALDYQRLMVPGTQLKEAVLPAPIISLATDVAKGTQAEIYYQFGWNKNRYAPIGTFFSAADFFDQGRRQPVSFDGNNFNVTGLDGASLARRDNPDIKGRLPTALLDQYNEKLLAGDFINDPLNPSWGAGVAPNVKARKSGQWGLAVHHKPEGLPMDIGVYYLRYHDKSPVLNLVKSTASAGVDYQAQFLEDRELFGVSANFPVGNWAVGTELSYRPKDAVSLGGCFTPGAALDANVNFNPLPSGSCPLWADNKKFELHLTGLLQLNVADHGGLLRLLGADSGFASLEGVWTRYPGVNPAGMTRTLEGVQVTQLPAAGYGTWLDDPRSPTAVPKGVGSANSGGVIGDFNWTYDGTVIKGWQVTPGVTYFRGVKGNTPTFAASYMQGVQSVNAYVLFNQNPAKWQAGINYTNYFGGGERNFYKDRSFFGGFVSYTF